MEWEMRRKDEEIDFWKREMEYWKSKHSELEYRHANQSADESRNNELEEENEVLKANFRELERQTALWLKELEGSAKHHDLCLDIIKGKEVECENPLKNLALIKDVYNAELGGFKTAFRGLQEKFMCLEEEKKGMSRREMRARERTAHLEEAIARMERKVEDEIPTRRCLDSHECGKRECAQTCSPDKVSDGDIGGNDADRRARGERHGAIDGARVVDALTIEDKMLNNAVGTRTSTKSFWCTGGKRRVNVPTGNTTERCFQRSSSGQRCEERGSSCEEDGIPLFSAAKRRRFSKIVTSDAEEDDATPLGGLHEKKLEELLVVSEPKHSLENLCAGDVCLSSGGRNVKGFILTSQQGQVSLTECAGKKSRADGSLVEEFISSNDLEMCGASRAKVVNLNAQNDKEKVSESEVGVSLSGDGSSDSEDALDNELDSGPVAAMMARNTNKELKWQNEADMLSWFEKHPVLCMKAVCALHRQKTDEGKSIMGPFSKFAAHSGRELAGFLTDGNPEGELKKSVEELETFFPEGLEDCKILATHYSKLLFTIYQNKEDPLFLPC